MSYEIASSVGQAKSTSILRCCLLLGLIFIARPTYASFTDSITIGNPKALSLGHAVTADPPDIDSIHFNPAGLARLKGRQMYVKGIVGVFSTEMEFGEYGEYTQGVHDNYREQYKEYEDGNGNLTHNRSPWEVYAYDEALNSKSESEGGPTIMLPGGMVDLPIGAGGSGGASYNPPGSRFTFGTNVYAPLMNGFSRSETDTGRFAQERVAFTVITYFSPTVAFEISDTLSVGASVNFNYAGMGMELPIREPHIAIFFLGSPFIQKNFCNEDGTVNESNSLTGTAIDLCTEVPPYSQYADLNFEVDNNLVLGYNMGMLWQPAPWLTLGLSYNSAIDVEMDGEFNWPVNDPFKTFLVNFQSSPGWNEIVNGLGALGIQLPTAQQIADQSTGPLTVSYEVPQRWNVGLSLQITPRWKYNLDYRWTEWSAFSDIDLDFGVDVPLLMWGALADQVGTGGRNGISPNKVAYKLGLQDVGYWGMGTEYQYSDRLVLRAGFEDRPSAVPETAPNAFIPMNDAKLISVGFGYDLEEQRHIDFAFGYLLSETHFPPCSAPLGNACNPNDVVYPVYMGQDIKTKVEAMLFELSFQQHF
ncbi:hypothetical protein FT643_15490 [Ketobacter sp. MCCC 1A13808]|uniref:OmpP1/FadL family transporter n=1 Tax=Ketobacter sp. MCCC 1A13808 TaxID=2602738 RepID=UPI000F26DC7F|nr:outer membrane protein transport protein [Ketobacter sp. MCCC 1A13808]MVF13544.1 hypothetical protein [Ketobacter sp. MCCC 1A13808]RLP53349.1 MAG: hypothetical protein D6160_16240 [Ketobacter sp.]